MASTEADFSITNIINDLEARWQVDKELEMSSENVSVHPPHLTFNSMLYMCICDYFRIKMQLFNL